MKRLIMEYEIEEKYRDHALKGNYKNRRELHIRPDWLLIYKLDVNEKSEKSIYFERTGSHSELFE